MNGIKFVAADYSTEDVGQIIKHVREDWLELSQDDLAKELGVKASTIDSAEKGNHNGPSLLSKIVAKYELKSEIKITQK